MSTLAWQICGVKLVVSYLCVPVGANDEHIVIWDTTGMNCLKISVMVHMVITGPVGGWIYLRLQIPNAYSRKEISQSPA
jgi:hypothetical protein